MYCAIRPTKQHYVHCSLNLKREIGLKRIILRKKKKKQRQNYYFIV